MARVLNTPGDPAHMLKRRALDMLLRQQCSAKKGAPPPQASLGVNSEYVRGETVKDRKILIFVVDMSTVKDDDRMDGDDAIRLVRQ